MTLVENLIRSLCAVISACMGPSECTIDLPDAVDCYIRLFLSAVAELDSHGPATATAADPIWVLNVPDAMLEYGMPRFLWEGGAMGEGILRRIKPLINGWKSGWNVSAHKRYQTVMALQQVIGTFDKAISPNEVADEDESADECIAVHKLYNYIKYGSIESAHIGWEYCLHFH